MPVDVRQFCFWVDVIPYSHDSFRRLLRLTLELSSGALIGAVCSNDWLGCRQSSYLQFLPILFSNPQVILTLLA